MSPRRAIRAGADIGGTFTDVVLDVAGTIHSTKVLTRYDAHEAAILDGLAVVMARAGVAPGEIEMVIHGTTLATNALIERRGARTAFVTTEGVRDTVEMRSENRFSQYDLNLQLPTPLVPREDRFTVAGRIGAGGQELLALDEAALEQLACHIAEEAFGAVAIGFLHSYLNPDHERRAREILQARLSVPISISSEVSPQMRELERFNTVCANAYVQPQIAAYLERMQVRLRETGVACPVFMVHSGGGLISVETAAAFPVRLVESGPAGGAIYAADVARRFGVERALSYDMGGTTAKICLIDGFEPQVARSFEVARSYRFTKGSGMAISIPVIEMIEIGAGGGSLASVDAMGRIQVGPHSAGSEPGPACYGRGGTRPAITDADLILGRLDPDRFAGGEIVLSVEAAEGAMAAELEALGLGAEEAAFGVCEVVDETMANAARIHAVENGKDIAQSTMIAFGGAAPLHAARLCEKLKVARCLVPPGAGVGSAIGFLRAPFAFEAVASQVQRMSQFDPHRLNAMLDGLKETADAFVREGARGEVTREVTAHMRYAGQGWEIAVPLPDRHFGADDCHMIAEAFTDRYGALFGRAVAGAEIECVTWSVRAQDTPEAGGRLDLVTQGRSVAPRVTRTVFDADLGRACETGIFTRDALGPGERVVGPAIIAERETSTLVTSAFDAVIQRDGTILLLRKGET